MTLLVSMIGGVMFGVACRDLSWPRFLLAWLGFSITVFATAVRFGWSL